MELKRRRMRVEATKSTPSASLPYELPLDPSTTLGHRRSPTLAAPKPAFWTTEERCVSVLWTPHANPAATSLLHFITLPLANRSIGLKPGSLQPIAHRRIASVELFGHAPNGCSLLDQLTQADQVNLTFWAMAGVSVGYKPVLLQPVADRRGMLSHRLPDRIERHPLRQAILQPSLFHADIISSTSDRKLRRFVTRPRARRGRCAGPGRRVRG